MAENLEERIIKIIVEKLEVPAEKVAMSTSFADDLKADSIDRLELVMVLEEAFKIDIPEEDGEKIKTVGDVVNYIKGRVKQ